MGGKLRQKWREFRAGKPGRRFQERFERNQQARHNKRFHVRALWTALAICLFLIGVVLVFIPGPAVLFFAVSGAILAERSRSMARLLDRTEMMARRVYAWAVAWWKRAPGLARSGVIGLGTLGLGLAGYLAYGILMPD